MVAEAALECLAQRGQLAPQCPLGQLGEQLRVVGAGDERVEHRPPGDAERLGGDRGELDLGVLEHLLEPLHLACALLDLRLAVADDVAQLAQRPRWHEARAHQSVLDQLADPLRVLDVGLASGDVAQVTRVQQPALELVLEQEVDGAPVDTGRLHPDHRHGEAAQPVGERQEPRGRGRKRVRLSCRRPPAPSGTRTQAVSESLCTSSAAQRSIRRSMRTSLGSITPERPPGEASCWRV